MNRQIRNLLDETWIELAPKLEHIINEPVSPLKAKAIACFSPPRERVNDEGVVYFVSDGEFVKIGFTCNLKTRLSTLQTMSPRPLEVLKVISGPQTLEKEIHKKFRHFHVHGEWFNMKEDLIKYMVGGV